MKNDLTASIVIKKEIFIPSRQDDITKHYQFLPKFLGRGAYGIVYRAKMIHPPHTQRAVKIVPKVLLKNPQNLLNQISILKRLDHPNIIRLYQTFEDKDHYYLVMDYCEGGELFNRLSNQGKFSEQDARNIFVQIIKILKYLHSQKIAHRDLKPQNFLMFSKDSLDLKVIDFGLSYSYQQDMKIQLKQKNKSKLIGTSYYIAPEVIQMSYDQRCDIWSAGVILYILVTATPPFDGVDDAQILRNIQKLTFPMKTPQTLRLSDSLKDLITRVLVPEQKRITIDQILNHPWMTNSLPVHSLELNFKKLKQFSNFTKLKTIAVTYIASQLPQKQIHKLGDVFKQIDQNDDGYLTISQIKNALQKQKENPSLQQLNKIIQTIDTDRNGRINYNQFVACCLQNSILNNQIYLQYVFKSFDRDNSGTISKKEFKQILESSNFSNQFLGSYIDEIMKDCDKDADGEIDYREFLESIGFTRSVSARSVNGSGGSVRSLDGSRSPSVRSSVHQQLSSPYQSPFR